MYTVSACWEMAQVLAHFQRAVPGLARACSAGTSTLRMAELAALALRALAAGSVPAQDAAHAAGAPPLLVALLSPAQNRHMAEERKARKENAASAAAQAVLALAEGNTASKVSLTLDAALRQSYRRSWWTLLRGSWLSTLQPPCWH